MHFQYFQNTTRISLFFIASFISPSITTIFYGQPAHWPVSALGHSICATVRLITRACITSLRKPLQWFLISPKQKLKSPCYPLRLSMILTMLQFLALSPIKTMPPLLQTHSLNNLATRAQIRAFVTVIPSLKCLFPQVSACISPQTSQFKWSPFSEVSLCR